MGCYFKSLPIPRRFNGVNADVNGVIMSLCG